jgi:hypothetical protein
MRRVRLVVIISGACAAAVLITAGCAPQAVGGEAARGPAASSTAGDRRAGDWPPDVREAEVYTQVLRRYLTTPAESSFPDKKFTTVYVLDRAVPGAGDPQGRREGTPIPVNTRQRVAAALAPVSRISFIADRNTVIVNRNGCAQVKDHGILITLGPLDGDDNTVRVGINGFVACLGATWLTYEVHNSPGTGWRVTGTTGPQAIA